MIDENNRQIRGLDRPRCETRRSSRRMGAGESSAHGFRRRSAPQHEGLLRRELAALFYPIARVTTHALSGYLRKPRKHRLQIAGDTCLLSRNCKPTCRTVHRRAGILHSLRHIFGNFRSAVRSQRRHSQPCFRNLGSNVGMTHAEMPLNLLQSLKMITHVGQRVIDQCRRKFHKLPGVWSSGQTHHGGADAERQRMLRCRQPRAATSMATKMRICAPEGSTM